MRYLISGMLVIAGVIHLLPLPGVLGGDRLASLYGISFAEPNLVILMRHRAVLFGLLGVFMLVAAFKPSLQIAAFAMGFVSAASFLWLAFSVDAYNSAIGRVFAADVLAVVCLVVGIAAFVYVERIARH